VDKLWITSVSLGTLLQVRSPLGSTAVVRLGSRGQHAYRRAVLSNVANAPKQLDGTTTHLPVEFRQTNCQSIIL
jgi:hypothetical protein